eukprot:GHVR01041643.1.p1 GENE.GHVR01041643.1~~GHVR01041643.1.p1  ORF type:complete len:215 (-),score=43.92 GHVR01041643.1:312-956(-)
MIEKIEAYVILPFGIFLVILLLSGVQLIQRIGVRIARLRISVYKKGVTLCWLCFVFSIIHMLCILYQLSKLIEWRNINVEFGGTVLSTIYDDKYHMKKFRNERNFWLTSFCLVIWMTVISSTKTFTWFWKIILNEEERVINLEKERHTRKTHPEPSAPPLEKNNKGNKNIASAPPLEDSEESDENKCTQRRGGKPSGGKMDGPQQVKGENKKTS